MFEILKNNKVLRRDAVLGLIIIFVLIVLCFVLGCSSAPKTYSCPNEHSISLEKIKKDIRAINTCPICGAEFPYLAMEEKKSGGYSFGYQPYYYYPGPRVWVYGYSTTRFHSYHHHGH